MSIFQQSSNGRHIVESSYIHPHENSESFLFDATSIILKTIVFFSKMHGHMLVFYNLYVQTCVLINRLFILDYIDGWMDGWIDRQIDKQTNK